MNKIPDPFVLALCSCPRWAGVAYAARCAAIVAPFTGASFCGERDWCSLSHVIAEVENSAKNKTIGDGAIAQGLLISDKWHRESGSYAGEFSAKCLRSAVLSAEAARNHDASVYDHVNSASKSAHQAIESVRDWSTLGWPPSALESHDFVLIAFHMLRVASVLEGWGDDTSVPREFLGLPCPLAREVRSMCRCSMQMFITDRLSNNDLENMLIGFVTKLNVLAVAYGGNGLRLDNLEVRVKGANMFRLVSFRFWLIADHAELLLASVVCAIEEGIRRQRVIVGNDTWHILFDEMEQEDSTVSIHEIVRSIDTMMYEITDKGKQFTAKDIAETICRARHELIKCLVSLGKDNVHCMVGEC